MTPVVNTAGWLGSAFASLNSSSDDWFSQRVASRTSTADSGSGSISGYLSKSASFSNLLLGVAQNQISSLNDIFARQAILRIQEDNQKQLDQALADLQATQDAFADNTPDPVTTASSATIDFSTNLMTMRDGTVIDIISGLKVDPITHLPYSPTFVTKVTT